MDKTINHDPKSSKKLVENKAKTKLLFVCTANIDRSPTGEDIYKDTPSIEAQSAGTEDWARKPITKNLLDWADIIFCMEEHHRRKILKMNPITKTKVIVLEIPDHYPRGDPELIELIKNKVSKYIVDIFR